MSMSKESLPRRVVDIPDLQRRYEREYPQAMSILRLGGVYPREHQVIKNPYTGDVHDEYFGNVGEHCVAVAGAAEKIAKAILQSKIIRRTIAKVVPSLKEEEIRRQGEIRDITERAIIHDSTKRFEVMRRDQVRAKEGADTTSGEAYTASAYETIKPILKEKGIVTDITVYMANAGKETGHNSMGDFVLAMEGHLILNHNRTLAEKIVHLADDMTYTPLVDEGQTAETSYLTVEERMKASDFPNRYAFLYKEGFGFDSEGRQVLVKDVTKNDANLTNVRTYADWQVWVAKEIARDLVERMELRTLPENAEEYLKDLVNQ